MKKLIAALFVTLGVAAYAQHEHHAEAAPAQAEQQQELSQATDAMLRHAHDDHDHHMGPHMKMSALRPVQPGDQQKADDIVKKTRAAIEKYQDPAVAEADGFRLFAPNMKHQKQFHYTNYRYAMKAAFTFNPEHPSSLLYSEGKDGKKKLIGAMFTAPARFTEAQLEERVPLSIAQWHQHVNLCIPPKDQRQEMFGPNPKFGLMGSISTESECTAAGGTFRPRIFGWMVHVYPWETTSDEIWSVERQRPENMAPNMSGMEHHH
jgi:hypothetical protein